MIILYFVAIWLSNLSLAEGFVGCSTASIGFCLRSLFDVWEHVRGVESHATNLLYPVPFYTKQSLLVLCNEYIETKKRCFVDEGCESAPMVSFVKSHLDFLCGNNLPIYLENYSCISSNLLRQRQCLPTIYGVPNPMVEQDRCTGLPKYFDCVRDSLKISCGQIAVSLLGTAIETYGCNLDKAVYLPAELESKNETGKYTRQFLEDFLLLERPVSIEELHKSKESSSESVSEVTTAATTEATLATTEATLATTATSSVATTSTILVDATNETTTEDITPETTEFIVADTLMASDNTNSTSDDQPFLSSSLLEANSTVFAETNSTAVVETSTLNSTTVATTSAPVTTTIADTDETDSLTCTSSSEEKINTCFQSLISRLATLSTRNDPSTRVRFPLFNVSLPEVLSLCGAYDEATKCAKKEVEPCYEMQLLQFLSGQLETLCFRIQSMKSEYQCLLETFNENPRCSKLLLVDDFHDKCFKQQEAFDCLQSNVICGPQQQTIILIKEMIRGYGCRVHFKKYLTRIPTTPLPTTRRTRRTTTPTPSTTPTSDDLEGSGEQADSGSEVKTMMSDEITSTTSKPTTTTIQSVEDTKPLTKSVVTTLITSINKQVEENSVVINQMIHPQQTGACSQQESDQVRLCMAPLLETWIRIHSQKPLLSEITFPVYSYTPREMLDLCDGYANLFLCSGIGQIKKCLSDQLISAAQDFLGYQCSPNNLPTFMKHYKCIQNVDSAFGCSRFIRGPPQSSRERKCDGFPHYVNCMVPLVQSSCGLEAIREFNFTVRQFGCTFGRG